jgi:glycerol-3-phosphate acyltransferase PlsY
MFVMTAAAIALAAFFCGAIPFSVILGRLFLHDDIRRYGDGNPGGGNAWRAGGPALGLAAIFLDLGKAFAPVSLALAYFDFQGAALVVVGLAPVIGHAFSPFLGFRGGKAIASTYGIWLALTGLGGPLAMAVASGFFYLLQTVDAWTVVMGMAALLAYLLLTDAGAALLLVCLLNALVVAYKHSREFKGVIELRPGFASILRRK